MISPYFHSEHTAPLFFVKENPLNMNIFPHYAWWMKVLIKSTSSYLKEQESN